MSKECSGRDVKELPRSLTAEELGVLPAQPGDSFRAGWWNLASQRANPLLCLLFVIISLFYFAAVIGALILDGNLPWWSHVISAVGGFLAALVIVYLFSVSVYECARRSDHAEVYLSAERDAVLVIERKNVDGVPTYLPQRHTVQKPGRGQGRQMRDALIPRLAGIVDGTPGVVIQVRAQNAEVKRIYRRDFERHNLIVETGEGRFPMITYPTQDQPASPN